MTDDMIKSYFQRDHERLDNLFKEFQVTKACDIDSARKRFENFRRGLEQHMAWEENILFPLFESKTGMKYGGPTQVMRLEHEQLKTLLKSLEEPPPGNVILLLVEHARNLFDTIVSRSIEIKVPPFASDEIRELFLHEGISREEAEFLSRVSGGNLSVAKCAREEGWFETRTKWIKSLLRDPFGFLGEFQSIPRAEAGQVFDFLIEWFRDLLTYQTSQDSKLVIHAGFETEMNIFLKGRDFRYLLDIFQLMVDMRKALDENANQKLTLTQAAIVLERFLYG